MTSFVASLGPGLHSNWEICRRSGLWGVVGRGSNWRAGAGKVDRGDDIFVWRGGRPNGFIAAARAEGKALYAENALMEIPWPDSERFGAVVPISVLEELETPATDSFSSPGRVGLRFGFNNTVLQHNFEAVTASQAKRIREAFPGLSTAVGLPYHSSARAHPVKAADPFTVDADAMNRGIAAHERTVEQLASWVTRQGLVPLLPGPADPPFDLAWEDGAVLNVAEVKSTTSSNMESQLRFGLGQVLRYRHLLGRRHNGVVAWLVPEELPSDPSWSSTCADAGVILRPATAL